MTGLKSPGLLHLQTGNEKLLYLLLIKGVPAMPTHLRAMTSSVLVPTSRMPSAIGEGAPTASDTPAEER